MLEQSHIPARVLQSLYPVLQDAMVQTPLVQEGLLLEVTQAFEQVPQLPTSDLKSMLHPRERDDAQLLKYV